MAQKKQPENQGLDRGIPFWFSLPQSFYLQLKKAAIEFGTTRSALVLEAIKLNPSASARKAEPNQPHKNVAAAVKEKLIRDYLSRLQYVRWEGSTTEPAPPSSEDFTQIFWLDLPESFFADVAKAAKRYQLSEKAFVKLVVSRFIQDHRKLRSKIKPISTVQEQVIKEFTTKAAQSRWAGVSAKDRRRHAQEMSRKRWADFRAKQ